MTSSYTHTDTHTFTRTHAKHIAAKVATDLKRIQRLYGKPSDSKIDKYEAEIIELLKAGYLGTVTYGFRRNGNWIEPTLRYTARDLAGTTTRDDDPGRIRPRADVKDASFGSYLVYSLAWDSLSTAEMETFQQRLPFHRFGVPEPGINGYLSQDLIYSSGGRALDRAIVKGW